MRKGLKIFTVCCFAGAGLLAAVLSLPARAEGWGDMFRDGAFTGEMRYRYEFVDQDGPAPVAAQARAGTVRANLGFRTAPYRGVQAFVEGQAVRHGGGGDFNDSVNGKLRYPVVADPDSTQLNQAWLAWSGDGGLAVKAGRQVINLDNQRFIGSVDWRQNDQTFDALRLDFAPAGGARFSYGYIGRVKRVFGEDHPLGELGAESHFINLSYELSALLKLTGYAYLLDFNRLAARSSQTYGVRATGKREMGGVSLSYEAEAAAQSDYGGNRARYDENYFHVAPALAAGGWTLTAGYEVLGGDGVNAFQTPLATLHKFNGWADKFLDTPAAGLEDGYAGISYRFSGEVPVLGGANVAVFYHDFRGRARGDLGTEIDASAGRSWTLPQDYFLKTLNFTVKYADYKAGDAPYTDTRKIWVQAGFNF